MANPRVSTERLTPLNLATENIGKVNSKGREPELPVLHLKDLFVNRKCAVKECSSVHSVKRGFGPNLSNLMTEQENKTDTLTEVISCHECLLTLMDSKKKLKCS